MGVTSVLERLPCALACGTVEFVLEGPGYDDARDAVLAESLASYANSTAQIDAVALVSDPKLNYEAARYTYRLELNETYAARVRDRGFRAGLASAHAYDAVAAVRTRRTRPRTPPRRRRAAPSTRAPRRPSTSTARTSP